MNARVAAAFAVIFARNRAAEMRRAEIEKNVGASRVRASEAQR